MDESANLNQKYCHACGRVIDRRAEICPKCGVRQFAPPETPQKSNEMGSNDGRFLSFTEAGEKKIVAAVCGILLGGFGAHKFILGYQKAGAMMLGMTMSLSFFSFVFRWISKASPYGFRSVFDLGLGLLSLAALSMVIVGMIEGFIYLSKSDDEFKSTYILQKKEWF